MIQDSIDTIRNAHRPEARRLARAGAVPHRADTMDLVAEMGLTYTCDLFHDDQPTPVKVRRAGSSSIPYSLEMNDTIVYNVNMVEPRRYGRDPQAPVRPPLRRGRAAPAP